MQAAEIIKQEISKKPTVVKLWCLLGDATGDVSHYETAWRLSEERSSRAQRHWGFHYFAKKDVSVRLNIFRCVVCIFFSILYVEYINFAVRRGRETFKVIRRIK